MNDEYRAGFEAGAKWGRGAMITRQQMAQHVAESVIRQELPMPSHYRPSIAEYASDLLDITPSLPMAASMFAGDKLSQAEFDDEVRTAVETSTLDTL